jgi:hypothetical protein
MDKPTVTNVARAPILETGFAARAEADSRSNRSPLQKERGGL